jgi:hypothetical protein
VLGRPKIAADVETAVRATLAGGTGMLKAAKLHGVGVGTVQRIARAGHWPTSHSDRHGERNGFHVTRNELFL